MATDRMPPPVPHPGEPTLAAFRAFLAEQCEARGTFAAEMIANAIIGLIDRYAADVAESNQRDAAESLGARLDNAGRVRRLAESIDTPALVIEAHAAKMPTPDIARRLACGESYVYRIIRTHKAQQ